MIPDWLSRRFYRGRHRAWGLSTAQVVDGSRTPDAGLDIHVLIDVWHQSGGGSGLHDFLGLTWDEYCEWVESGILPEGCGLRDGRGR